MHTRKPLALLFDLGGVVIDIDFDRAFKVWQPRSSLSVEEMRLRFSFDLQYQRHERGEIAAAAYYDHLASILKLDADHAHIDLGWNSIYVGEITETTAMVRTMRNRLPCHAFTNTNAAHMGTWCNLFPAVVDLFDRIFASHVMGIRKPERKAFDHISQAIGVAPGSIVFFDDLLENVQAASAAGFQGVHVRSPNDVRNALESFGYAL